MKAECAKQPILFIYSKPNWIPSRALYLQITSKIANCLCPQSYMINKSNHSLYAWKRQAPMPRESASYESESESTPFPLTWKFPLRMMCAAEDWRREWEPHRPSTRPSSSRRPWSCTRNRAPPTPRWPAGSDATRAAFRTG